MGALYLGQRSKRHGQVAALAVKADSWTVTVVGTGLLGCTVTSAAAGLKGRIAESVGEWKACGSQLVDGGQPAAPGGIRSETAVAAGGSGIRRIDSLAMSCGSGIRCTRAEAGAGVVAEAVANTRAEAAASCGLQVEERIAVAAGTVAGIEADLACEGSRHFAVEASAGSWCLVAGRSVPSPPCSGGEGVLGMNCWHLIRIEDVRP